MGKVVVCRVMALFARYAVGDVGCVRLNPESLLYTQKSLWTLPMVAFCKSSGLSIMALNYSLDP